MITLNFKTLPTIFLWTILCVANTCLNAENEQIIVQRFNHNNFIVIRYDKISHATSTQSGDVTLEARHTSQLIFEKCAYGIGILNFSPSIYISANANYHVFTKNFDCIYLPGGTFFSPKTFFKKVIKKELFSSEKEFEAVIKELISQIKPQSPSIYDIDKIYKYLGAKEVSWAPLEVKERLKDCLRVRFFAEVEQIISRFDAFDNIEDAFSYAKYSLSKFVKSHLLKSICKSLSTEEHALINIILERIAVASQGYCESKIANQEESNLVFWKEFTKIILTLDAVLQQTPCNEAGALKSLLMFAKNNISLRLDVMKENLLTFNDIRYFQRIGLLFIPNYLKGFDSISKDDSTDPEIATLRDFLTKAFYGINLCLKKSVEPSNDQTPNYYSLYFKIENKRFKFLKFFNLIPDNIQQEFLNDAEALFEPYITKCLTNMTLFERIKIFHKKHFLKEAAALGMACTTGLIIKFYPHMALQSQALKCGYLSPLSYVASVKFRILTINDYKRILLFLMKKFNLKKLAASPCLKNIVKQICTGNAALIEEFCNEIETSGPSFFKFVFEMQNINQKLENNLFKILKECGKLQKYPCSLFSIFETCYEGAQTELNFENYKNAALKAFSLSSDDFANLNHASFLKWKNLAQTTKECLNYFSKEELIHEINGELDDASINLVVSSKLTTDQKGLFEAITTMDGCSASVCDIWALKNQLLECLGDANKIKELVENFYIKNFDINVRSEDPSNNLRAAFSGHLDDSALRHIPLWPIEKECAVCLESFGVENFRSTGCHCRDQSVCDTCANKLEVQDYYLPRGQYRCPKCRGTCTITN